MATNQKNLSDYDIGAIPSAKGMKIGIVVSEWNIEITHALYKGAYETLIKHGVNDNEIIIKYVPGTFELTLASQWLTEYDKVDAVIAIGCVIRGETSHFDYICQGVTNGITNLNLKLDTPIIFGILTTENTQQAFDRAGGIHGNKGIEAAVTAIKMIGLKETFFQVD